MATGSSIGPRPRPVHAPRGYGFPESTDAMRPWDTVEEALAAARTYWLGTTLPDGRPYATPLWAVWVEGALYFDGMPTTRWARNFEKEPRINVHLELDRTAVIVDGVVEDLETDADLGARIVAAWSDKYGDGMPEPVERGLFRLRPVSVRAWSESLRDGAAWSFASGERD